MHSLFPNTTYNSREVCAMPKLARGLLMQFFLRKVRFGRRQDQELYLKWLVFTSGEEDWSFVPAVPLAMLFLPKQQTSVSIYKCLVCLMLMKLKSSQGFTEFEGKLVIGLTGLLLCPWDFDWHKRAKICIMYMLASADLARTSPAKRAD